MSIEVRCPAPAPPVTSAEESGALGVPLSQRPEHENLLISDSFVTNLTDSFQSDSKSFVGTVQSVLNNSTRRVGERYYPCGVIRLKCISGSMIPVNVYVMDPWRVYLSDLLDCRVRNLSSLFHLRVSGMRCKRITQEPDKGAQSSSSLSSSSLTSIELECDRHCNENAYIQVLTNISRICGTEGHVFAVDNLQRNTINTQNRVHSASSNDLNTSVTDPNRHSLSSSSMIAGRKRSLSQSQQSSIGSSSGGGSSLESYLAADASLQKLHQMAADESAAKKRRKLQESPKRDAKFARVKTSVVETEDEMKKKNDDNNDENGALLSLADVRAEWNALHCLREPTILTASSVDSQHRCSVLSEIDAQCKSCCIYGFVSWMAECRPSRGIHSHMQQLRLRDASTIGTPGMNGLQVMMFAMSKDLFPQVQIGDVIRIHRCQTQLYRGYTQILVKFNGAVTDPSFIVFDGKRMKEFAKKCALKEIAQSKSEDEWIEHGFDEEEMKSVMNEQLLFNCEEYIKHASLHSKCYPMLDSFIVTRLADLCEQWINLHQTPEPSQGSISPLNNRSNNGHTSYSSSSSLISVKKKTINDAKMTGVITLDTKNKFPTLSQLSSEKSYCNLVCMIVAQSKIFRDSDSGQWRMTWLIWDGTDNLKLTNMKDKVRGRRESVKIYPYDLGGFYPLNVRLQSMDEFDRICGIPEGLDNPITVGNWVSVMHVKITKDIVNNSDDRSSHIINNSDDVSLTLTVTKKSVIRQCEMKNDRFVSARMSEMYQRLSLKIEVFQQQYFGESTFATTTIRSVLTIEKVAPIGKYVFNLRVRLCDWFPKMTPEFVSKDCLNHYNNNNNKKRLCLSLRITDSSHSLNVIVVGKEAEKYFGLSVSQFEESEMIQNKIGDRLKWMKNNMDCVFVVKIRSFRVDHLFRKKKRIDYRLVDTCLKY